MLGLALALRLTKTLHATVIALVLVLCLAVFTPILAIVVDNRAESLSFLVANVSPAVHGMFILVTDSYSGIGLPGNFTLGEYRCFSVFLTFAYAAFSLVLYMTSQLPAGPWARDRGHMARYAWPPAPQPPGSPFRHMELRAGQPGSSKPVGGRPPPQPTEASAS
jgi:hypothetical protein